MLTIIEVRRSRLVEQLVPGEQRRPQGAAGVAGGRLNPEAVKRPFTQQSAVGHAVEGDSARQDEIAHPGLRVDVRGRVAERPLP